MVRVRFAPSPTGLPHIGNIRTAIFNWLFARHHDGAFILRIEDTDRERYDPDSLKAIIEAMRWLGLDWDEGPEVGGDFGPYFQSQRLEIYHKYARKLVEEGKAYYCDCSPERLERIRREMRERKLNFMYDRRCRDRGIQSDPTDPKTVIRFKMPLEGETCFYDELRGEVCFDNSTQDDIVLIKSDGFPTYNFAVVVDDHLMRVSHIFRGEEFISSAGKHRMIYDALGWEPPKFVHLPIILGPDKSKLSKRHGATSIGEFRDMGFLPEAMFNYLALLGWSPKDDAEILSREELIRRFDIDGLSTKSAVFDIEKLEWMNGEYIREMTVAQLSEQIKPYLRKWGWCTEEKPCDDKYIQQVCTLMQPRLRKFADIKELGYYFFHEPTEYEPKGVKKQFRSDRSKWLEDIAEGIQHLQDWSVDEIENLIRGYAQENNLGVGKLIHAIRLAVSGITRGPGLFELIHLIGRERTVSRLRRAARWIEQNVEQKTDSE